MACIITMSTGYVNIVQVVRFLIVSGLLSAVSLQSSPKILETPMHIPCDVGGGNER